MAPNIFDFHVKDMASEESLWNLYERWCRYYSISRSFVEKQKRFNKFKSVVMSVHSRTNKPYNYRRSLNHFADMTDDEKAYLFPDYTDPVLRGHKGYAGKGDSYTGKGDPYVGKEEGQERKEEGQEGTCYVSKVNDSIDGNGHQNVPPNALLKVLLTNRRKALAILKMKKIS